PIAEKRPVSERKLAANRMNSTKSTGPRSPETKAISCMNGLKHGRRAKRAVLPGESQEEFDAQVGRWEAELHAETEIERRMARSAVEADWRLRRHKDSEDAALARLVHAAEEEFDNTRAAELDELVEQQLFVDPRDAVRQLRRLACGTRWLAAEWRKIG